MWTKQLITVLSGIILLLLVGCGSTNTSSPMSGMAASSSATRSGYGVVQSIDMVPKQNSGIGVGTIAGAVVGGALGNQIGQGSGRTAATIAGAAGGALAGRALEGNAGQERQAYRVFLRMDDGTSQTLVQETPPDLQIGDRVRVANGLIVEHAS